MVSRFYLAVARLGEGGHNMVSIGNKAWFGRRGEVSAFGLT